MLVLFETAAGFAIFKLLDEKKLKKTENLFEEFETPDKANKIIQLQDFKKFADSNEAMLAGIALNEGKICKPLKKILKKTFVEDVQEKLLVWDPKLGSSIKEKLGIEVVSSGVVGELMRCIKSQVESLIPGIKDKELSAMSLGLAHNLSRYKLKFSPDKVDTMIVQAISLLDDIDKELNNYIMRAREWYGWHFPELSKILTDHTAYIKCVMAMGTRDKACDTDFSDILPEELEERVKEAAEISMGTEIAEDDLLNINCLCEQIIGLTDYRVQLYEYLKNRMQAIAPNLNILVGELVGARLISHAGSLLNLAKHPASTIQILGAEKALFHALKNRTTTPKYGLIFHAHMVGQASTKNKGKVSRMLAAKAALAIRYDALGEDSSVEMGMENASKLNSRMRALEAGYSRQISGRGKSMAKFEKYENNGEVSQYDARADSTLGAHSKRKFNDSYEAPKAKRMKVDFEGEEFEPKIEAKEEEEETEEPTTKKKKKKKKQQQEEEEAETQEQEEMEVEVEVPVKKEKKKKKKKKVAQDDD